jgi:hypothetical protein
VDDQQQARWRPTRRQLLWASAAVALMTVAVLIGYRYGITLWDWIKLLIVPAVIAGGGVWFNAQQREREQQIANNRAQDEALQAYLDQMSDLLIPSTDRPSLYDTRPPDSLRSVARARTLTVLPRLDGDRKRRVVQFVYEAELIDKDRPILDVHGSDLSKADLRGGTYFGADRVASLFGADLSGAYLIDTDLSSTNLSGANLQDASGLFNQPGFKAGSLQGAIMPNGQQYEDWLKSKGRGEDGENSGPS